MFFSKGTEPSLWYCLTVRVDPPKKVSGFAGTPGKACRQAGPGDRGEAGHALGVDQTAGSRGRAGRTRLSS